MRCPICDSEINTGYICNNCNMDAFIYTKVKGVSIKLYNKGISLVKASDLSGAITALSRSITFDKTNINARNLLGLVYFETGRIGSALRQWIISASYLKEDNLAQYYLDTVQSSGRAWEKLNDAVLFYNQALVYLQQRSEDMAVIRLKKAIEINPKFIDALNLLTLGYIATDEKDKALQTAQKTLKLDGNNTNALVYYLALSPTQTRIKPEVSAVKKETPRQDYTRSKAIVERRTKILVPLITTAFFAAALCGVIVSIFYSTVVIPPEMQKKDDEIEQINNNMTTVQKEMQEKYDEDILARDERIAELLQDNVDLLKTNDELTIEGRIQAKVQEFQFIQAEFLGGNLYEAADLLYDFSTKDLPVDYLESYDSLKAEAYASASEKYYSDGVKAFNSRNYENAMPLFENCVKFGTTEKNVGNSLYYLGYIAELAKDYSLARNYYSRVVDEFPTANQFRNARNRLNKLPVED